MVQPGSLYHSLELGPFYYMLRPSLSRRKKWGIAEGSTSVKVNNEGTLCTSIAHELNSYLIYFVDVSRFIYFSSYRGIKTMIPEFIREKLSRYAMLVPPLVNEHRQVSVKWSLKDAIFVPTQMLNSNCGGILLYEQLDKLQTADDAEFCNRTFGKYKCTCICTLHMHVFNINMYMYLCTYTYLCTYCTYD